MGRGYYEHIHLGNLWPTGWSLSLLRKLWVSKLVPVGGSYGPAYQHFGLLNTPQLLTILNPQSQIRRKLRTTSLSPAPGSTRSPASAKLLVGRQPLQLKPVQRQSD